MDWWRVLKIYAGGSEEPEQNGASCGIGNHSWVITEVDDSGLNDPDPDGHVLYVSTQCSKCGKSAMTTSNTYWDSRRHNEDEDGGQWD